LLRLVEILEEIKKKTMIKVFQLNTGAVFSVLADEAERLDAGANSGKIKNAIEELGMR